jgi:hypothetical protein
MPGIVCYLRAKEAYDMDRTRTVLLIRTRSCYLSALLAVMSSQVGSSG